MSLRSLSKLVRGLARTRESLADGLRSVFGSKKLDDETVEDLEATLLAADLGPALTAEVIDAVRKKVGKAGDSEGDAARAAVVETLRAALPASEPAERSSTGPHVIFVVGVNGGGKTTTVGKLASRERAAGRSALVVAADTFRAAAIEQLERWSERAGVDLIKRQHGADASSVVFDALEAAKARGVDTVLVDTAGRLQTKRHLMEELGKLGRVATRLVPDAPHEVLLVVDATTGQNGLSQAREFTRVTELTGVVLTKLDGTAKGGVALGIHRELGVPIRYVGVGEGVEDLLEFDPVGYVEGLIG